jgi:hypothetical protein
LIPLFSSVPPSLFFWFARRPAAVVQFPRIGFLCLPSASHQLPASRPSSGPFLPLLLATPFHPRGLITHYHPARWCALARFPSSGQASSIHTLLEYLKAHLLFMPKVQTFYCRRFSRIYHILDAEN